MADAVGHNCNQPGPALQGLLAHARDLHAEPASLGSRQAAVPAEGQLQSKAMVLELVPLPCLQGAVCPWVGLAMT